MNNISQAKIIDYLADFKEYLLNISHTINDANPENKEFWAYVAGREHKEKPYPPITPIKAQWVKHER